MPNFNPPLENLTNAGKGRPLKNLQRIQAPLSRDLVGELDAVARSKGWTRNYLIEQLCRTGLGMPADYDLALIRKGSPRG